jgi:hypothetical protein
LSRSQDTVSAKPLPYAFPTPNPSFFVIYNEQQHGTELRAGLLIDSSISKDLSNRITGFVKEHWYVFSEAGASIPV